jgi:hypothetical protein
MTEQEPRRIYLGAFEGGLNKLILPARALDRANNVFDAERAQREREASRAKTMALQDARNRGKLKKALTACFGHRRRGR